MLSSTRQTAYYIFVLRVGDGTHQQRRLNERTLTEQKECGKKIVNYINLTFLVLSISMFALRTADKTSQTLPDAYKYIYIYMDIVITHATTPVAFGLMELCHLYICIYADTHYETQNILLSSCVWINMPDPRQNACNPMQMDIHHIIATEIC